MTKSQNKGLGESKSPALRPEGRALRTASDQAALISADKSSSVSKISALASVAGFIGKINTEPLPTCRQTLWFTFFFDGTGNNLAADESFSKHSNVAKLFRAHSADDTVNGTYAIYIPGVGTYFAPIGDNGGSKVGLGTGSMGEDRLKYALKKFDDYLMPHSARAQASPSAAIVEINMAMFGFSRGAALARAFLNMVLTERCVKSGGKWILRSGKWPMRFRFIGLFDTVASVGLPMSANTTSSVGAVFSSVRYMLNDRLQNYLDTRPQALAFSVGGLPGADPAPGRYDGHADWGGRLIIDDAVEEVRHFVAAHEIRNSFPVDSISILSSGKISKPAHFHETVYPGVHSDVGGSYAPGEGARSNLRPEGLGLIPLIHMYKFAMEKGVPLLPVTAWNRGTKADFEISKVLIDTYNDYLKKLGNYSTIGQLINRHMSLYFSWRFRAIKMRAAGNCGEASNIAARRDEFAKVEMRIDEEIKVLEKNEALVTAELNALISRRAASTSYTYGVPVAKSASNAIDPSIQVAQERRKRARDEVLEAKARKLANPEMDGLFKMLELYDAQLIDDVNAIRDVISRRANLRLDLKSKFPKGLRPHYKALLEAYENEFEKGMGLSDQKIIDFFDNYVHDSLAAFAGDATLPSDPRVIYLGGDEKYQFAARPDDSENERFERVC